jgi:Xaa-Pro aminopeptidase
MSVWAQRADRLAALVEEQRVDLLLVSNLLNVRYLTGFSGTNGAVLIGPARRAFLTDFRYLERAQRQIGDYDVVRGRDDLLEQVAELVRDWDAARVGFDDTYLTVRAHAKLAGHLTDAAELVPASGLVERLRVVKSDDEIAAIRRAAELADDVYRWLISDFGLVGHTEREVAVAMELRARELGADRLSFEPIVAAADNGALPHAEPRADVQIPRDTLVVVDYGVVTDSYCSDCTRTFATGDIDAEARECYELVRSAQVAALEAVRAGAELRAVDAVARDPIAAAGRGEQFGHGLGHGVGLEVHEGPRLAPTAEGTLAAGNVVTVEPGVYVPGRFGVRIEDLTVVGPEGPEVLTSIPKDLTVV